MCKSLKKIFYPMSSKEEEAYALFCSRRILKYNKYFLFIIIGIQTFNILYTLFYTQGRLHTTASRVYFSFYIALFLMSVAGLFLIAYFKKNSEKLALPFQKLFAVFLIFWSACVTIYDQRVSRNISVYLIVSLTTAFIVYFTPLQTLILYFSALISMYFLLPLFQKNSTDNYGSYVNITIMTFMAAFICIYRNFLECQRYLDQETIMKQNQLLLDYANRDVLTRLRNRRFLEENISDLYQQCIEKNAYLTMMMIDIDYFKRYNDTYGHQQGDECLRRVAWRLEQELDSENEYMIRYGGEEFLYIGIGIDENAAAEKGRLFNQAIRDLIIGFSDQDSRNITVSIGIYTGYPTQKQSWETYISNADKALYQAKNTGRDKFVILSHT